MINNINQDVINKVYNFSDMTNEELRCKFFQKLQECIDLCNNSSDILEWIKSEGLENKVNELMELWKDDGTLEEIINNYILITLKNEILSELNSNLKINLKSFSNLSLIAGGNAIIEPKSSKSFSISLSENIPQTSIISLYFNTDVENGVLYDYRMNNENELSIRFTNVTDNSITLNDKEISLKVIY